MCGIVAMVGTQDVVGILISGLRYLAYRGYDSAGIATVCGSSIERRRAEGKLIQLEQRLQTQPLQGRIGIAHTRWATHGRPSENNAHPHATPRVAVVHNGIIENYRQLRAELPSRHFDSETDTEVIVHLVTQYMEVQQMSGCEATAAILERLEGAFAIAMLFAGDEQTIVAACRGTPLVIGAGNDSMYLASDAVALTPLTRSLCYLEDGDWAVIKPRGAEIFDHTNQPVERPWCQSTVTTSMVSKSGHRHFMHKEIFEQPKAVDDTLNTLLHGRRISRPDLPVDLSRVTGVRLVACGTAFYAAMVAQYWIEQLGCIPVTTELASEFRYRQAHFPAGSITVVISQSGETLDTLEALRYAKSNGQKVLSIVNVSESTIARESDALLCTRAGPEIGVASTKAFTTQLTVLACLALALARSRETIPPSLEESLVASLRDLPSKLDDALSCESRFQELSHVLSQSSNVLYLGRGTCYPLALEGALKLKEISYIHAEGYAAGEMKHGPIALIDDKVPVVTLAPGNNLFRKMLSNLEEVRARGGRVLLLTDTEVHRCLSGQVYQSACLPEVDPFVVPILYALPIQLLAYHTAAYKGTDIDQPRNLAKSVTVE